MQQTARTAIVLRYANYRENDRMLTLFNPQKGLVEALCRGCRKPRSPLVSAGELFALGDFELYEKGGHVTVTGINLIESFYPLRSDYEKLTCGVYLLNLTEAVLQTGQGDQQLFMLLLHTLSRLTFSDQPWKPLLAGFLLHFADIEGFKPRLNHCADCGRPLTDNETTFFDTEAGGLCCRECTAETDHRPSVSPAEARWLREKLNAGSADWVNRADAAAPVRLLRNFVESRLDKRLRSSAMLAL